MVELAGIGPGPFCAMLLSDLGAEVIRVDRPPHASSGLPGPMNTLVGRGKRSIAIDLKTADGVDLVLDLVDTADVLIEPFRPGVAERIGLGPEVCMTRNPALVYGRMTGWGREGPLADRVGHDINYIGLVGALHAVGRVGDRPVPPLNLVGDYGGGSLYLAMGILAALVERSRSETGEVVDAAMIDGAASLMLPTYEMLGHGIWDDSRESNLLDGAAPFYDTYETSDGRYVAVGPIEPQFYASFLDGLGLTASDVPAQLDPTSWPEVKARFQEVFRKRTRDEWAETFAGRDACVTPVMSMTEAPSHPHNVARGAFVDVGGITEPGIAPRFDRSVPPDPAAPPHVGADTRAILEELAYPAARIDALVAAGVVLDGESS